MSISWQNVFDSKPDSQTSQPKIGLTEAASEFADGQLVLRTLPGRVDLVYQPSPSDPLANPFQALGNVSVAMGNFKGQANILMRKLRSIPDIQVLRLAFGAELDMSVPDKQSAYNELNQLLHSVEVDPTSSDFQYVINRKRKSQIVADVEINRLSVWSAVAYHQFVFDNQNMVAPNMVAPNGFACRLVLDINTVPTDKRFPLEDLEAGYEELLNLGTEIAQYGDIS
jgi:hypothetical protein